MFITFEGIEGSGKSTILNAVERILRTRSVNFLRTREPGGTSLGDQIRELFLHSTTMIDPIAEIMLMCASRAQLCRDVIHPALRDGKVVLCDRFFDSTLAYQAYGRGLNPEIAWTICQAAVGDLIPDLTILFDIPVATSQARMQIRADATGQNLDRIERETIAYHQAVRAGYLEIAKKCPSRVVIIDTLRSVDEITTETVGVIGTRLLIESILTTPLSDESPTVS